MKAFMITLIALMIAADIGLIWACIAYVPWHIIGRILLAFIPALQVVAMILVLAKICKEGL